MKLRSGALWAVWVVACSSPDTSPTPSTPAFPADYASTYVEVRGCRKSADHELDFVRVLADPAALGPYSERQSAFPDGAVVLKEQYDPSDDGCTGAIAQWTVMVKNHAATARKGWDWQRVDSERKVVETNTPACIHCHAICTGASQPGYDFTCTEP